VDEREVEGVLVCVTAGRPLLATEAIPLPLPSKIDWGANIIKCCRAMVWVARVSYRGLYRAHIFEMQAIEDGLIGVA
jgi:hypothetical protein